MQSIWDFILAAMPWIATGLLIAILCVRNRSKKNNEEYKDNYGTEGMCVGMCLGTAIGTTFGNNTGTGISLGMLIGLAIGTSIPKKEDESDNEKNRKWNIMWHCLLLIAGIGIILYCFNQEGFSGSRVKNPDSYLMDIERMNGTDWHSMELHEGDVLQIHFETVKGSIRMEIKGPDGSLIYSGNGRELTDFTVNIPESGVYTITLEASNARGALHIRLNE